jgi:glutamate carboxypeptidase
MDGEKLLTWCSERRASMCALVETLVRLESPSTDKTAVNRCGDEIAQRLLSLGARVERLPGGTRGDHIRAQWTGEGPRILILGHFDTVWPVGQLETMPFRERCGQLFGPGIYDMKAGIAVALFAAAALRAMLDTRMPRIVMLWTADEEIGSGTSRRAIEAEAAGSEAVLVLEPSLPGGAAKTSRKGCAQFELVVRGVAAHAGLDPTKGASAIHELAFQILEIQGLQDAARGIGVNVGVISGGSRANVVASDARALIDVRVPTMTDAERITRRLYALQPVLSGTRLEVLGGVDRPPLERGDGVRRLYGIAAAVARDLGRELGEGSAGGGSDGNFTAALGVPTLDGLGPQGDGAHALHEHVLVNDLPWRAAFLATLMSRLARVRVE